jgi:type VI secretion system protein ImpH
MNINNSYTDLLQPDFRAEVVAAEMIDKGIASIDQLMIVLLGASKRSFRKDVDTLSEDVANFDHKDYITITTHKEGIYDMLPEGLFHRPALPKTATTEAEILAYMRQHRVEEQNARRFFQPFEAAINHQRIQVALYEGRLDKGAHYDELLEVFAEHWEIFDYLDTAQANIFIQILPLIHDLRDDHRMVETIFHLIFNLPVTINMRRQLPIKTPNPIFSLLSDCRLGVNMTTSNDVYDGGEDELIITIGPITNAQLQLFSPDTTNSKILELLSSYLLPIHIETSIEFELDASDKTFRLADEQNEFNSTLGLSTFL